MIEEEGVIFTGSDAVMSVHQQEQRRKNHERGIEGRTGVVVCMCVRVHVFVYLFAYGMYM